MLKSSILYAALFACSMQAMNDFQMPMSQSSSVWYDYIENGDITAPHQYQTMKLEVHNNIINTSKELEPILNSLSTHAFAAQLANLPTNEIATRYDNYQKVFSAFMSMVIIKQYALDVITKYSPSELEDFFVSPVRCFKDAENRMVDLSKWLDAIRASGEEDYIGKSKLTVNAPPTTPSAFWQETLEKTVLLPLMQCYWDKSTHLDPTSMAILRHQLRKGFPNLEYKKDTAYTGPAICRVKKGEKSGDWDFQTFMKTLELAEEEKRFNKKLFFPASD